MDLLDKEIKDIKEKLLPSKSTPEYNTLSLNLKSHLEKRSANKKQRSKRNILETLRITKPAPSLGGKAQTLREKIMSFRIQIWRYPNPQQVRLRF